MSARSRKLLVGGMAALLVAIIAGVVIVVLQLLPFQYQRAHRRWAQQQIHHYELEVAWADGWSFGHARVEMRDDQFVRGVDLDTGQPLAPNKLLYAGYFGSVDKLFAIIEKRVRLAWNWRNLLARYVPAVARRLDSCVAPLGEVNYDSDYGYPSNIWYNDSWCTNTFFNYSNVKITQFTPLP